MQDAGSSRASVTGTGSAPGTRAQPKMTVLRSGWCERCSRPNALVGGRRYGPSMTNERLPDQWHSRDLPVLLCVARLEGRDAPVGTSDMVAIELEIPEEEATTALLALDDGRYIKAITGGATLGSGPGVLAVDLRERGRRVVGLWPGEDAADSLVDALRQAEDATSDPEERTAIRRAWSSLGGVSRDVMVDVVAAVIARQSGVG